MPILTMFEGIIIRMYADDHNPPHFHAEYRNAEATLDLDGEIINGELPRKQLRFVQAWVEMHRDELEANWKLAKERLPMMKIEPLKR